MAAAACGSRINMLFFDIVNVLPDERPWPIRGISNKHSACSVQKFSRFFCLISSYYAQVYQAFHYTMLSVITGYSLKSLCWTCVFYAAGMMGRTAPSWSSSLPGRLTSCSVQNGRLPLIRKRSKRRRMLQVCVGVTVALSTQNCPCTHLDSWIIAKQQHHFSRVLFSVCKQKNLISQHQESSPMTLCLHRGLTECFLNWSSFREMHLYMQGVHGVLKSIKKW